MLEKLRNMKFMKFLNLKNYSRKVIIISVSLIIVVGIIVYFASSGAKIVYETEIVKKGVLVQEVSIAGSIAPMTKVNLQPEVGGIVEKIHVAEGDEVEVGDVLLEIGAADIEAQILAQRASLASSVARLRELQAGATIEDIALSNTVVDSAQSQLDAAISAQNDTDIAFANAEKNLENAVAKAETVLDSKVDVMVVDIHEANTVAIDAVNRVTEPLFTNDDLLSFSSSDFIAKTDAQNSRVAARSALELIDIAASSIDSTSSEAVVMTAYTLTQDNIVIVRDHLSAAALVLESAVSLSSVNLASYQASVNTGISAINSVIQKLTVDNSGLELQKRLNDTEITSADIQLDSASAAISSAAYAVEAAEKNLLQAEAQLTLKEAGSRPEIIASQQARVNLESAKLTGLRNDLAKRQIVSPADGTVTLVAAEEGETVQPSAVAIVVHAKGSFEIIANISEIDIAKVSIGNPVLITLDAFTRSDEWMGKVISIQPAEKVVEGIIFYETKISFDESDARLRSGMTANLDIETNRSEDTIVIPYRAIDERDDKVFVDVMVEGFTTEVEVTLGLQSFTETEVLTGLNVGDEIVVFESEK